MRRVIQLVVAGSLVAGIIGVVAVPAGAQAGDVATACAARLEGNTTETKADNLAVLDKIIAAAPATIVQPVTQLKALVTKKGNRALESEEGSGLLSQIDAYFYDNCAGTQMPVTAIDYDYQGVPATLQTGAVKVKFTNAAPKEEHEMALLKLQPGVDTLDLAEVFKLSDKKAMKFIDFASGIHAYAGAGQTVYSFGELKPGNYVYACFLPQGGKNNGKPHFLLGMEGTLTVS